MNLETTIDKRLWDSVKENYENHNFSSAILDSVYFLNNLIREKTGLESDGVALVGQALGGKQPKLKVNSLQSESDWNIQNGLEQILRGFVQAIRNPRSHEKYNDSNADANAIIVFVDYLVRVIDQSKTPFTKSIFLSRVFDPYFVENDKYAELMASEIPARKRLDVMIDVFRKKEEGDGRKLRYFVKALLSKLSEEEIQELYKVISDELKDTGSEPAIRRTLQLFPIENWHRVDEISRLRIENRLLKSIEEGAYDGAKEKIYSGSLGTWAGKRTKYFTLKTEMLTAIIRKLAGGGYFEQDYIFGYLFDEIPKLTDKASFELVSAIRQGLKKGDSRFRDALLGYMWDEPCFFEELRKDFDGFKAASDDDFVPAIEEDDMPVPV
jgi:uncharacterized protein (TIGR02391 family)